MNIQLQEEQKIADGLFDYPLPVIRVLYEAEQPVVYLTKNAQGQEMLAYLAGETVDNQFTIVVPAARSLVSGLESGSIGIREALTDSWMWLVKEDFAAKSASVWSITESEIPASNLPKPGTPLLPEHRIAFSARAIGDGIVLGSVPCSVIAFVANAAKSSLKTMLDHALAASGEGRPTDAQRALYDLPVRQLRFASFEIGLAAPKSDFFPNHDAVAAVDDLRKGLAWAQDTDSTASFQVDDGSKAEAILRATLALTPPGNGPISAVEVGGYWLKGQRYRLTHKSRTKIKRRLLEIEKETIFVQSGRIGEIDDDKLSFILRDLEGGGEQRCMFEEELLDDMRLHYYEQGRVVVSGVIRAGRYKVTNVVSESDRLIEGVLPETNISSF
jgi:hypothetical protein